MGTAKLSSKTKWDKNQLRQEVTVADAKFTRTWQVSADGKQLVLTSKLERAADGAAAGAATRPIKFGATTSSSPPPGDGTTRPPAR